MEKDIGIYIHIPFCVKRCYYCDFVSYSNKDELIEQYIDAVCNEILQNVEILSNYNINTIYFGGGTPSYIPSKYIVKIMDTLKMFSKSEHFSEVTIEVNPNSLSKYKLQDYIDCGINRYSIGLQSTHDQVLKSIGRVHNYNDFINTLKLLKIHDIKNISVDLIYPLPGLTLSLLNDSLDQIITLKDDYNIKHISIYNLEVHENTKLDFLLKENFLKLPGEDEEYDMRTAIINKLTLAGYNKYEISNFAVPGYESKHNLSYWKQCEYLGFGLGASSFFSGRRFKNINSIEKYIESVNNFSPTLDESIELDMLDLMKEYIILRLRLSEGVNKNDFKKRFGQDINMYFKQELSSLIAKGLLLQNKKSYILSNRGAEVANIVWEEFI